MITPVARKYAKALMSSSLKDDIYDIQASLALIARSYCFPKVRSFIYSPTSWEKKLDVLMGLSKKPSESLRKFLKVLALKNRLSMLPQISEAINFQISVRDGKFSGLAYSDELLSKGDLASLEAGLSEKLGKDIHLSFVQTDFKGVRIEVDMLNVELSFSKSAIKSKLIKHILKSS